MSTYNVHDLYMLIVFCGRKDNRVLTSITTNVCLVAAGFRPSLHGEPTEGRTLQLYSAVGL